MGTETAGEGLLKTPLYDTHVTYKGKIVPFLKDNGEVYAQWGSKSGQQCKAPYSLAAVNEGIAQATAVCQ